MGRRVGGVRLGLGPQAKLYLFNLVSLKKIYRFHGHDCTGSDVKIF